MKKSTGTTPRPRLAAEMEQDIRTKILAGQPAVGEKLPTERALSESYGVSRTVVREAVAGLRAAGLIESKRGSGLYVRSTSGSAPGGLFLMPDVPVEIFAIIDTLELRAAVEIEAAVLAANRASPGQIEKIRSCHRRFAEAVAKGDETEGVDFDFHQAIADATNNSAYCSFMEYLGRRTIPRSKVAVPAGGASYKEYLRDLQDEHQKILLAIESHSPEEAKKAMQAHLLGSLERYRALSREV